MMSQPEPSLEAFSRVVESIYDCALNPDHWPEAMRCIAELTASNAMGMGIFDHRHRRNVRLYDYGFKDAEVRLYFEKYAAMSPLFVARLMFPLGEPVTLDMLVDEHEFLGSRFYQEAVKPFGERHLATIEMLRTPHRSAGTTVYRNEGHPPYDVEDLALLRLLSPHICRTFAISDALDLRTITSQALEATLDALATGVYLTEREGRVVYMNRAAERQIKTGNALRIVNHRLAPVSQEVRVAMRKAIADAVADEAATPTTNSISLALPDGDKAGLVAMILPLDRGQRRMVSGPFAATAAIFVQDPVVVPLYPGEAFAKLYGLSGGELRVLLAMAPPAPPWSPSTGIGGRHASERLVAFVGMRR